MKKLKKSDGSGVFQDDPALDPQGMRAQDDNDAIHMPQPAQSPNL